MSVGRRIHAGMFWLLTQTLARPIAHRYRQPSRSSRTLPSGTGAAVVDTHPVVTGSPRSRRARWMAPGLSP